MGPALPLRLSVSLLAQGRAGAQPIGWWDVLRHDVIPVASAFVVFLGLLVAYRRATRSPNGRPAASPAAHRRGLGPSSAAPTPGWGDLVRHLAGTVAGGYVFFLAIVVVFYFVLGGEDGSFIRQALVEGSLLAFALVVPAFLLLARIEELARRRGERKRPEG